MIETSAPTGLWALVEHQGATRPDALLAMDEHEHTLTFGEFRDQSERVAAGLSALGVGPDVAVSWQMPTRLESIVLVGALARLGAVQNPCLPIYRERELRYILGAVQPRLFVVPGPWRGIDYPAMARGVLDELEAAGTLSGCQLLVSDDGLPEGDPATLPAPPVDGSPDDAPLRWIFFTSGTTSDPKGALHTDFTLGHGAKAVVERLEMTERDRYPIVFPFTHIGGIGMLACQLMTGAGAFAVEGYDPQHSAEFFGRNGLTIAAGGTPLALLYLQAQRRDPSIPLFPNLRLTLTGAAPKPPTLDAELLTELGGVGSVSVYGLTEAPYATVGSVRDPASWRATTEGRVIPDCALKIVDPDGNEVSVGETGEILIAGPLLCRGYLDPARNADAFDADGYFRSGDLGAVDEHGNLTVNGRLKDVIIRKGENISAKELEDVLYEHADIADIAVIGLPDPTRGERACAVVVLRDGAAPLDIAAIADHCRGAGLAVQKIPEQVEMIDVLPRNASGKILKYQLQEKYS